MPETSIAEYLFTEGIEDTVANDQMHDESDWANTIRNLMALAKENNSTFEYDRAINYLNTLEEIWDSKGLPDFSQELRLELHQEKGKAFASQGKHEEAISEYQKILNFCKDTSQLSAKAETFTQIGQLLAKQGDHDRALGYLQRAIGAYRRLNDTVGMCRALRNLGVVYVELGEFEEAELNYSEAIDMAEEIGEDILYADLVNNLGAIMNMKGNGEKALELYRKSLKIYQEHDQTRKNAYTMNNIAITLNEQGVNDEAFEYFQKAYDIAVSIKDSSLKLIVDINLADLYLKKGDTELAKEHCHTAEKFLLDAELINGNLVEAKKIAGKIAYHEQEFDAAMKYYCEAVDISRQIGTQYLEAEALMERGVLCRAMGKHIVALSDLESSYHIYTTLKADSKRDHTEHVIGSIEKLYLQIFDSMAKEVDHKDKYTKGHSDRVASFALLLAKELGLQTGTLKTIVAAALLHDLGKIEIDDNVLKKAGKLTPEEYEHIKNHPRLGVELLRGKEFPWDIKPMILHHHERIDGNGYPLGLKGEDIPLGARVLCIADVFDALTSDRIYRKAFGTEKALKIMNDDSGKMFDPVLLKCFVNMVDMGKADLVINSRTNEDQLYNIWSQCTIEERDKKETLKTPINV
jgi:putative nucleotidyltransferase with HDIG domain